VILDGKTKEKPDIEYPCEWGYKLIGTDNAGSLGRENAILFIENMNLVTKFRPLQLPNEKRLVKYLDQI